MVADGLTVAEIIDELPDLTAEDVAEALCRRGDARAAVAPLCMRFLLDENLSPKLVELLGRDGHEVVHVRDIGLASALSASDRLDRLHE
jgi:Domain of unknown function (DUF5615)/Protein of unknown function (DUF433)